jgi:hypothetical protein
MGADDDRSDDLFPQDDGVDELETHIKAVYELVSDYMDDLDLSEALMAHVLLNAAVNMRMVAYAMEMEKPSTRRAPTSLLQRQRRRSPAPRSRTRTSAWRGRSANACPKGRLRENGEQESTGDRKR